MCLLEYINLLIIVVSLEYLCITSQVKLHPLLSCTFSRAPGDEKICLKFSFTRNMLFTFIDGGN